MLWNKKPKKSLSGISHEFALRVPPPKTKKYKTILTLLDIAERWKNTGDIDLEKQAWLTIAEKAKQYSEGREFTENNEGGKTLEQLIGAAKVLVSL